MTVREWVAARTPSAPPALRERVASRLGESGGAPDAEAAERCGAAGVRLVDSLISSDCSARENAIDLLAADALVTYAIERAAETSADFAADMDAMVARVASIAARSQLPGARKAT